MIQSKPSAVPVNGNLPFRDDLRSTGLSAGWQWVIFAVILLAMISRRPSDFLHAQFYAEDGAVWYANAYNYNWLSSLSLPEGGYLNTIQRLVAGPSLLVSLRYAPLLMNIAGLLLQALPVCVLLSRRCSNWGPLRLRAGMALIYVAIPFSPEIHVVLTNSQWHLAVSLVLLGFASPPDRLSWRLLDAVLFGIGSVSGPFGIILLPLLLVFWWLRRQSWTLVQSALLAAGGAVQALYLLANTRAAKVPIGASFAAFVRITGGQIFLNGVLGSTAFPLRFPLPVLVLILLFGLGIIACGLRYAPLPMPLFSVFALVALAAALKQPLIAGTSSLWISLSSTIGGRYWFYPDLVFLWSALWCAARAPAKMVRYAGYLVLVILPLGAIRNWRYPALIDQHFPIYVDRFQHAHHGDIVVIPVYPTGTTMELFKK